MSAISDLKKLLDYAESQGWREIECNGSRHSWGSPEGKRVVFSMSNRPSARALVNVMKDFERNGLDCGVLRGTQAPKAAVSRPQSGTTSNPSVAADSGIKPKPVVSEKTKEVLQQFTPDLYPAADQFVSATLNALFDFLSSDEYALAIAQMAMAGSNSEANVLTQSLSEATNAYIAADDERKRALAREEAALKKLEKMETHNLALAADLKEALKERDEALERANKAETRLRTLREALGGDL